jgi:F-type H+-transporting ATPase subunit gamma
MAEKARDIRRRIESVESTKKITNAMQLIAASRIGKAQARTERARPYAKAIGEMIEMLAEESSSSPLLAEREIGRAGILVITGDRGLSGAYNANVLREAQRAVQRQREAGREVKVISIGRKGGSYFRFRGTDLAGRFSGMADKPSYEDAQQIAEGIIDDYIEGRLDTVLLTYTEFLSSSVQRARVAQILPVPRPEEEEGKDEGPKAVFEFEPEPDALLEALLPKYVEVKLFGALLESSTSEHAARMRAMKSATDKAEELIKTFQLKANNARQSEITNEIADIVGGTEALSSAQR